VDTGENVCDRNYGARPLRKGLQKYVEDPLLRGPLIQGGNPKGRRHSRSMSQGKTFPSGPSVRQPRLSTSESDKTHG